LWTGFDSDKERAGVLYFMKYVISYVKKNGKYIAVNFFIILAFSVYFIYLVPGVLAQYLQYILKLLIPVVVLFFLYDFSYFMKREKKIFCI